MSLLINNVGKSYPNPLFFSELGALRAAAPPRVLGAPALTSSSPPPLRPPSPGTSPLVERGFIENMVHINLSSAVEMTALVLPGMLERKRGAVVNISSAAGNSPVGSPLLALYSATKAAVDVFSRSLYYELKGRGVHVECQVPYFVTTKLSKIRRADVFNVSPRTFVASSLAGLGRHGPSFVPHWSHALQDAVLQALPRSAQAAVQGSMHAGLRARALKKHAEGSKAK